MRYCSLINVVLACLQTYDYDQIMSVLAVIVCIRLLRRFVFDHRGYCGVFEVYEVLMENSRSKTL